MLQSRRQRHSFSVKLGRLLTCQPKLRPHRSLLLHLPVGRVFISALTLARGGVRIPICHGLIRISCSAFPPRCLRRERFQRALMPELLEAFMAATTGSSRREGDISWTDIHEHGFLSPAVTSFASTSLSIDARTKWLATTRARLGFVYWNTLWYATGGGAWTEVKYNGHGIFLNNFSDSVSFSQNKGGLGRRRRCGMDVQPESAIPSGVPLL